MRQWSAALYCVLLMVARGFAEDATSSAALSIDWQDNWLIIAGPELPGGEVRVHYLEAYCRPNSTDADWVKHTMIPHKTHRVASKEQNRINLVCQLQDGVVVTHDIKAEGDEVSFHLAAENPTQTASEAHWAQPCIRVEKFTGKSHEGYVPQCFVYLEDKLARLPTQPWATKARYIPGQVYCPKHVPRTDVNPRPLSDLVPSNGLMGCFSADEKWILATAWEPYQELFQGVGVCIHSDFRIGGLQPGEKKTIRGKIYITDAGADQLLARYERDFPEQPVDSTSK